MGRLKPGATIAEVGIVAALYAALTIVLHPASYGPLQFRVAEVLKPLVIWEPHLIAAFVIGNFLSNVPSPYGLWDLLFMPLVNLVGASLCFRVGRRWPYAGAALYALAVASGVSVVLAVVLHRGFVVLFPAVLASEAILIIGGVPVMRSVLNAAEPARRRWRPHPEG